MNYIDVLVNPKRFRTIESEPLHSLVVPIGHRFIPETLNDVYKVTAKSNSKEDWSEVFCFFEPMYVKNVRLAKVSDREWELSLASKGCRSFLKDFPEETNLSEVIVILMNKVNHDLRYLTKYHDPEKKNI